MQVGNFKADIAILGHLALDIVEIDGKRITTIGGPVYYGGIAGSHMGLKIIVITRLKKEDFSLLNDFEKYGIKYFVYPSEETSGLNNIYSSENMEYRICKPLGFAGLFKKEEIPELSTKYFVIGPILAGEIDISLLEYLYNKFTGKICLDIQGFVRVRKNDEIHLQNLSQDDIKQILSKVNILKIDYAEAQILTNNKDVKIQEAGEYLSRFGPKEILITHSQGISVYVKNKIYFYPWKNKSIRGRTGRGDTSFISYLGSRISKNQEESLKFAAALTSLKLESPGAFKLPINLVIDLIKKEY